MAEEVIFPSRPLFMVDRGWQRRTKKAKKNPLQAPGEQELDLVPSRVPEVTITVAGGSIRPKSTTPPDPKETKGTKPSKGASRGSAPVQFMNYEPTKDVRKPQDRRRGRQVADKETVIRTGRMPADILTVTQPLPGTATPLYSVIDPEVSSFQRFITYYPTRMAASMYPISKGLLLTHNPIETVWLPAVLEDEVGLHAILFSCAMHFSPGTAGQPSFKDSDLLMKVLLNRLNRRINAGKYSDLTIGAVSCLALCENHLGNHAKWKMHATGMSEMIRARGGFHSVRDALRMKIYRSDTIGSVDTLSYPNFSRPVRTTPSLFTLLAIKSETPPIEALLENLGLSQTVQVALVELSHLCQALNHAADKRIRVEPEAFDEDVTCIQHDLLISLGPEQPAAERLVVIAALIFIQTLTRERPFTRLSSVHISQQLKEAFPAIDVANTTARLLFWVLFMGGLVSTDTDEKLWFRRRLRDFQQLRSDLEEWQDVKSQLQKVFWVDNLQEQYGYELWQDFNSLG